MEITCWFWLAQQNILAPLSTQKILLRYSSRIETVSSTKQLEMVCVALREYSNL
jgi:hypothetical protein